MADHLGVNKNTLIAYEKGKRLPDVDFLAIFSATTGVNFVHLLRLRLEASSKPEAQQALSALDRVTSAVSPPVSQDLLQSAIEAVEQALAESQRALRPGQKAQLILALCDLCKKQDHVDKDAVLRLMKSTD